MFSKPSFPKQVHKLSNPFSLKQFQIVFSIFSIFHLQTEGSSFIKTARNQAGKQEDTFIREFQTNDAFTMVNITLNRPKCFKQVLMEILEEDNWKKKDKALHKPILLFPFLKRKTKSTEKLDEDIECFDDVRVLVLTLHLRNLLEANGFVFK